MAVEARTLLTTQSFRVYTANDVVGVELGGALKNIIAIGAGFNDGMGYGDNAKAAFITRGIAEIVRLGLAAGRESPDLYRFGRHGRPDCHMRQPFEPQPSIRATPRRRRKSRGYPRLHAHVAEGVTTTKAALQLAEHYNVDMPITRQLNMVLFENLDPQMVVPELMMRDPKDEMEGMVITLMPYVSLALAAEEIHSGLMTPGELVAGGAWSALTSMTARSKAFVTVMREQALQRCGASRTRTANRPDRSPLHGIPIGVKDLIAVQGVRMTAGSQSAGRLYRCAEDAAVVE